MATEKKHTPINVGKKLKYKEQYDLYTVQLVHRRRFPWWWLLLLLLPLLLFIKCHKDIEVRCFEPDTNYPVTEQLVTISYQSHFLWDEGRFLANDSIILTQETDSTGTTVFRDLPCSVYSYIFYCLSKVSITAESDCYTAVDEEHNFHYTRHVDLCMPPKREDLHVKLVDLETGDPLPDGVLKYKYMEAGQERMDSAKADPSGVVTIPQMRYCSVMKLLHGSCYGYADTTKVDIPCHQLIVPDDNATLCLRPLKERFSFYVKNVETKEPIPGAICEVTLTHPISGKVDGPHMVSTSTDGKGIVVYEESFVLSVIGVKAHKEHFRDSVLTGGPWTVEKFIVQDTVTRTIWLKPLPYTTEFVNVDSVTGVPIPGVKNIVKVIDPDGTVHTSEEFSNSNGVFLVNAKEDSKVEIESIKDPEYKQKRTVLPIFKDVKDKKIRMSPNIVKLLFRTVNAIKPSELVPNCHLRVIGSISGKLSPDNSGAGVFEVTFNRGELLTIVASRKDWRTTTDKVNAKNYDYLKADQTRRDIPLELPCNAGEEAEKGVNEMHHNRTYSMGQAEGKASIWVDFYDEPDHLKIIDGEGNVVVSQMVKDMNEGGTNPIEFSFKGGAVTVIIETSTKNGSSWRYILNCPHEPI
jgi:hypothetical protein